MRTVPEDAQVRFYHERVTDSFGLTEPRGGTTTAKITLPDGTEILGVAECSPRDNYSKKIGRDIALGRALKELHHE